MAKGSKKNVRKGKRSTGAPAKKEDMDVLPVVQTKAQRRCAENVAMCISLVYLATLALLYAATHGKRCAFYPALERASYALDAYQLSLPKGAVESACGRVRDFTHASFFLSGRVEARGQGSIWGGIRALWVPAQRGGYVQYGKSWGDAYFALTWGVVLFSLRGVMLRLFFLPLSQMVVKKFEAGKMKQLHYRLKYEKNIQRFGEQWWTALLYSTSFMLVLASARRQPFWPFKMDELWTNYPHTTMDGLTKAMYLWEASNYIHQIFAINVEEHRSDYFQMFFHHIITLLLLVGSYVCNFWHVGTVILLLLDPSDVFLALAKMLKYMGWQRLCDVMFGLFMLSWTFFRHVCYMFVLYSCMVDAPRLIPFTDKVDLRAGYAFTKTTFSVFIGLLIVLQLVLLVWYSMIIKVAARVVTNAGAIDSRSDEESD